MDPRRRAGGVGDGPESARAIRDAARIAAGLRAEWLAVMVRRPFARPGPAAEAETLEANLRLAESLGGQVTRVASSWVAAGLLDEARRPAATRIVVGRSGRSRWAWGRERVLEQLVWERGPIDIVVAGAPLADASIPSVSPPPASRIEWRAWMLTFATGMVAGARVVGRLRRPWVDDHDMAVVSLLIVVAATLRFGRVAGVLAVVVAALGIDLLFLHPEFQLDVADTKEIVSLVLLLSAGVVVAELVVRVLEQRELALLAESRLTRLLELSRRLADAATPEAVGAAVVATVSDVTGGAGHRDTAGRQEHLAATAGGGAWPWRARDRLQPAPGSRPGGTRIAHERLPPGRVPSVLAHVRRVSRRCSGSTLAPPVPSNGTGPSTPRRSRRGTSQAVHQATT